MFQCPGGVSDFGPSAQNSARTRASRRAARRRARTARRSPGSRVAVAVIACRGGCCRGRRADVDGRRRRWHRARCCIRMTWTASCLNAVARGVGERGGGPGSIGMPSSRRRQREGRHVAPVRADDVCTLPGTGGRSGRRAARGRAAASGWGRASWCPGRSRAAARSPACSRCRRSGRLVGAVVCPNSMTAAAMRLPSAAGESPSVEVEVDVGSTATPSSASARRGSPAGRRHRVAVQEDAVGGVADRRLPGRLDVVRPRASP